MSPFDPPIAVAVLAAAGRTQHDVVRDIVPSASSPSTAASASCFPAVLEASQRGIRRVVVPLENVAEAQIVDDVAVHGAADLREVLEWPRPPRAASRRRSRPRHRPRA
ncbi:hypothetical protein GCM10023168_32390 [Fodinibacter luteus]|uniref:Magnesium chelatase ChlI-like catalytic domain-containing protein n=1 Tax=Fodinibacter luteus TaxID=552064 RepID=A0ABP8KQ22_9MICO